MPKSRQRDRENYSIGARIYAMAANMLQDVDGEEWTARGLSKGDVMLARALGSIHLRINSIELGLKHILVREMGRPVSIEHDLVILWDRLIDDSGEGIQLRPLRWLAPPIARRSGVAQHLAHRPSRQAKPFGGLALTEPCDKDTAPYLSV